MLWRPEAEFSYPTSLGSVLVTGAAGSIGEALRPCLERASSRVFLTDVVGPIPADDVSFLDVRNRREVDRMIGAVQPDVVLHLAGAKHAPEGEMDPRAYMEINAVGTQNVIDAAAEWGVTKVVVASTCKAADPETAYGASKLLAERIALNAGQVVARYYNVVESSGNVFETWRNLPDGAALPVASGCVRIFMSMREAVALTLWAATQETGRYALRNVSPQSMMQIAIRTQKDRRIEWIGPRRGDRLVEKKMALNERYGDTGDIRFIRIVSHHDVTP